MSREDQVFWALVSGVTFLALAALGSYAAMVLTGRGHELYAWTVLMVVMHGPVLVVAGTVGSYAMLRWRASRRFAWVALALAMLVLAGASITLLHYPSVR